MPITNPRVPGDLPYPFRTAIGKAPIAQGVVTAVNPGVIGTGYTIGDPVIIDPPGAGGVQATAEVLTVGGSGEVTSIQVTNPGKGYISAPNATVTGSGTGATATVNINAFVPITKGFIYTSDADGELAVPTGAPADLTTGIMQAIESNSSIDDDKFIQVVTPPGRILLKAPAGLKKNDKVDLIDNASPQDKVQASVPGAHTEAYLGRIFEIETKNTDLSVKIITEENDIVVVDLGVV